MAWTMFLASDDMQPIRLENINSDAIGKCNMAGNIVYQMAFNATCYKIEFSKENNDS